jgi:hypothetical protein
LREAAADVPGVRIAWQPDDPHFLHNTGPGGIDCTKSEVHYLIGVEMQLDDSGSLAVEIRALDQQILERIDKFAPVSRTQEIRN